MVALALCDVEKTFTMHLNGGARLPVLRQVSFTVREGESAVLTGPSGCGKSSLLKMIFGNYRCDAGRILVHGAGTQGEAVDIATASPRRVLQLRATHLGYVSQFLRVVPRVPTLDVVAEPLLSAGVARQSARRCAAELLRRLNLPEPLWGLPPITFSGGEQQRVNIARGLLPGLPILLLDEPTASLDPTNRDVVVELIGERRRQGVAVVSIVHDDEVRARIADTVIDVTRFSGMG